MKKSSLYLHFSKTNFEINKEIFHKNAGELK